MSRPLEASVVRRARLRIGLGAALVVTLLVLVVGGIAYGVMVSAQNAQGWRELRYSTENAVVVAPPGCTYLFAPGVPKPPGSPQGFPIEGDFDEVRSTGAVVERTVERNGTVYLVRTQPRDGGVVQGVFDMRFQLADRRHLLTALAVAELLGLLAAALTGLLLGRHAVDPLAQALDRQRRFVTDAGHELRTPIAQAYTRAQVLARQAAGLPTAHREGLMRLVGSVRRLGEIVDDLLLSAQLAVGGRRPGIAPVDLGAVVEGAVADAAERARAHRLIVSVHRSADALLVEGVASALRRAVDELLTNAIRNTPTGGRIELVVVRSGDKIELTVSDTGVGFAPEEARRIFDRFHRVRSGDGDDHDGRYGLGLALLHEVVTGHRGTVDVSAQPGQGARFTIRLPALTPR